MKHPGLVLCAALILTGLSTSPGWTAKCDSGVLSPGFYHYTVDGRTVAVRVPSSYTDARPAPVLVDLHGAGLDGDAEALVSRFQALCDEHGFIGVWPSGSNGTWSYGIDDPSSDVQYIRHVVDYIRGIANVDRSRVYLVGVSQGGAMTNTLVCEAADVFAAAAPDSMQLGTSIDLCTPSRPVSVMEWHGYEDMLIPYDGGTTVPVPGGPSITVPSAPDSLLKWAQIMGCTGDPVESPPPDGSGVVATYTTCGAGTRVGLGSIHGNHGLYAQFNIQEFTWSFLTRFTLPLTRAQLDACPGGSSTTDGNGRSGQGTEPQDPASGDDDGGGGGCFIATAVYGSSLDPRVAVLRAFRDRCLLTNTPGRVLVRHYYRWSPPAAAFIGRHVLLKAASRAVLAPVVCAARYPLEALLVLLSTWGFVFVALGRRRRPPRDRRESAPGRQK